MSLHEDEVRLSHMLDHAKEAVQMCESKCRSDLNSDRMLNLALVRLIEIIGEAASRVSLQRQANHPDIPWREIIGTRNRVVHGYDKVNFDILWGVIREDLPALIETLKKILN